MVKRSLVIGALLILGTVTLVALEVRVFQAPPSATWFVILSGLAFFGFGWSAKDTFPGISAPGLRLAARALVVFGVWAVSVFIAIVVGVNLKLAIGGHL